MNRMKFFGKKTYLKNYKFKNAKTCYLIFCCLKSKICNFFYLIHTNGLNKSYKIKKIHTASYEKNSSFELSFFSIYNNFSHQKWTFQLFLDPVIKMFYIDSFDIFESIAQLSPIGGHLPLAYRKIGTVSVLQAVAFRNVCLKS